MADRPQGPFAYYADIHGGGSVTGDSIRQSVDEPGRDAAAIATFAADLHRDKDVTVRQIEGQVRHATAAPAGQAAAAAHRFSTDTTYAVGAITLFAGYVTQFDAKVAHLNALYQQRARLCRSVAAAVTKSGSAAHVPVGLQPFVTYLTPEYAGGTTGTAYSPGSLDTSEALSAYRSHLMHQYKRALAVFDDHAAEVVRDLNTGPTHANIRALVDAGAISLTAVVHWPWLHLSDDEMRKALQARVDIGAVPDMDSLSPGGVQAWLRRHPEISDYLFLFPTAVPPTGVSP